MSCLAVYEPTDGQPVKRMIMVSTKPEAELIMPLGTFTIYCEVWDKFGTYVEVLVGTVEVRVSLVIGRLRLVVQ